MACDCVSHIGSDRAIDPLPTHKSVEFVEEGMRVVAPVREVAPHLIPDSAKATTGLWCEVAVAAGTHARIVNKKYGVDRWVHISILCVPR